uniref:Probable imidazolonepropionase n=1 Tax=Heterorhabditis bacteriophora TaxID=37862 RepID=A0A1I7XSM4_HETBA
MDFRLLITGLKQVVQITDKEDVEYLKEDEMNNIKILSDPSSQLSILVNNDGLIVTVGSEKEATFKFYYICIHIYTYNSFVSFSRLEKLLGRKKWKKCSIQKEVNWGRYKSKYKKLYEQGSLLGVALPGFVDAHSHPVFAGDRVHEFAMKLAGATYMEVQAAGGGIHFTTNKTREASEEQLLEEFIKIAKEMVRNGTTTLEAKSGYGLDTETEMKMLRVLSRVSHVVPIEVSATFCGAHAVPNGSTELKQVELICGEMLDKICSEKAKGGLANLENIDVFCEKGVFGVDSTCVIKISYLMSKKKFNILISGVIVALGSDFNPNAYCLAMPMIMHLACVTMHLSLPEALVAATINAAYSLGRGHTHGAIAPGRKADIVVLKAGSWEHIIYRYYKWHEQIIFRTVFIAIVLVLKIHKWDADYLIYYRMAAQDTVIKYTIKNGRIVHSK